LGFDPVGFGGEGKIKLQLVTAFPGKETIIEESSDLRTWVSISTNLPSSNYLDVEEPLTKDRKRVWFRAVIP